MIKQVTRFEPAAAAADRIKQGRLTADCLLHHADRLDPEDQQLIKGVYGYGMSAAELGRMTGRSPHCVRRRLRRILQRLSSPMFRYVIREANRWPERRRRVAEAVIVRGRTMRAAAAELGITMHRVREELLRVKALCEPEQE